ncbi:hypothetical protein [Nostoc sp. CALU 1950]|uniref:hypothetical protein n=1 Tax=Nostoc sp. CALU 1950 TaxID=3104321 RepID=UPI003EBA16FC
MLNFILPIVGELRRYKGLKSNGRRSPINKSSLILPKQLKTLALPELHLHQ